MIDFAHIPFRQARWFTPTDGRTVRKIVLHSMEAPEKGTTSENVAQYFATTDRKASAHYCVDDDSVVQCVQTRDVAYAAPGANRDGVHIELAGYAAQTEGQWLDAYSRRMLRIAAMLVAKVLIPKFGIPLKVLSAADMQHNPMATGITTHRNVSLAFKKSTHTDPGKDFPMDDFISFVKEEMAK